MFDKLIDDTLSFYKEKNILPISSIWCEFRFGILVRCCPLSAAYIKAGNDPMNTIAIAGWCESHYGVCTSSVNGFVDGFDGQSYNSERFEDTLYREGYTKGKSLSILLFKGNHPMCPAFGVQEVLCSVLGKCLGEKFPVLCRYGENTAG